VRQRLIRTGCWAFAIAQVGRLGSVPLCAFVAKGDRNSLHDIETIGSVRMRASGGHSEKVRETNCQTMRCHLRLDRLMH